MCGHTYVDSVQLKEKVSKMSWSHVRMSLIGLDKSKPAVRLIPLYFLTSIIAALVV